jgi:GR25 family glycosyltransferase involved in LPS biosynthesis
MQDKNNSKKKLINNLLKPLKMKYRIGEKREKVCNPLEKVVRVDQFMSQKRCAEIIKLAEAHGAWQTTRHNNYPTMDIPVDDIQNLNVQPELHQIAKLSKSNFNLEANATLTPFDVFVVKYDVNGQRELKVHRDNSELSFVLLLSSTSEFEGGGTYYEHANMTVCPEQGGLLLHCGKVRHAGKAITKGTRYVLIGFLKVASFRIGQRHKDEAKISNELSDKRHVDFLWRHDTMPTMLAIRIINLKDRPEKLQRTLDTLRRLAIPDNWVLDIQPVVANEGNGATAYPKWKMEKVNSDVREEVAKFWKRDVTKGEIGCFVSHMSTIQASNAEYLLVLEDDADMHSDFLYRVDQCLQELKEKEWDAIDFGGVPMDSNKKRNITTSIVQQNYTYQTHCILYHARGMKKVQTVDCTKNAIPYDEFLGALRKIHPRSELNTLYATTPLMVYHPYTKLSWQRAENIHDTERHEGCSWTLPQIVDSFDMRNYYKFSNVSDMSTLPTLLANANDHTWKFQLSTCVEDVDGVEGEWMLPVDHTRKVTVVVHPTKLWIQQGKKERELPCRPKDVYFFPAYLLYRYIGGRVFYGCGTTFH